MSEIPPIAGLPDAPKPTRKHTGNGRPSSLPVVRDRILASIRAGLTLGRAAALAGVTHASLCRWRALGRSAKTGMYRIFFEQVEQALAEAERDCLETIRRAALTGFKVSESKRVDGINADGPYSEVAVTEKVTIPQWQAAAWLLERRYPKRYGKKALAPAGAPGEQTLTPEDFAARAAAARQAMQATVPDKPPASQDDLVLPEAKKND